MTLTKEQRELLVLVCSRLGKDVAAALDALLAAYDVAQRDAARYQLLRRHCYPTAGAWQTNVERRDPRAATPPAHYQRDFDAAIDAAIAATKDKP